MTRNKPSNLALYALFSGACCIALAPILVRISPVQPIATGFWRLFLALPPFLAWSMLEKKSPQVSSSTKPRTAVLLFGLAGVFFTLDLSFWHWSIRYTSIANATLLANFAPIFVALGGWLFFRLRVSRIFILGMIVAIAGVVILLGGGNSLPPTHWLGDLLGVITAVFYGAYILTVSRLRLKYSTVSIMTWSGAVSAALLLPVAILFGESLLPGSLEGWLILATLALIVQFAGQGLITYALAQLPASFSSVGLLLQPALAAVFAWFMLGENMGVVQILGGCLAILGIFITRQASR